MRFDTIIVGAGAAGAMAARTLADQGRSVQLIEALPRVGGRLQNARMVAMCGGDLSFDHGGQFMTVRDPHLQALTEQALADKALAPLGPVGSLKRGVWCPLETEPRYRGRPDMASFIAWLSKGVAIEANTVVQALEKDGAGYRVITPKGEHTAGSVILALPPQALVDLGFAGPGVRFDPCWAVSLAFDAPLKSQFDSFEIHASALSWAARQPAWRDGERFGRDRWVLHLSAPWSAANQAAPVEFVLDTALQAFSEALCEPAADPAFSFQHLWREAKVAEPLGKPCFTLDKGLLAAGDWCPARRVEAALLSGRAAAHALLWADGVSSMKLPWAVAVRRVLSDCHASTRTLATRRPCLDTKARP